MTIAIDAVDAKLFLFSPKSEALSSDAGLDIQQLHEDMQKIPFRNVSDMNLVFDQSRV